MVGILSICVDDVEPPQMLSLALYTCLFITQSDICQIPFLLCCCFCFCCCGICWIPPTGRWVNKATPDSGDYTLKSSCKVNRAPGWYFRAHEGQIQVITLRNQPEKSIAPDYPREMMVELNWKGKDILGWLGLSIGHWGAVALPVITFCSVSHSYSQYNYIAVQFCICSSLPPYNIWVQNISVEIYCTDSTIAACREINGLCHIHQGATARELLCSMAAFSNSPKNNFLCIRWRFNDRIFSMLVLVGCLCLPLLLMVNLFCLRRSFAFLWCLWSCAVF